MTIGPAPMIRIEEMSVRLGILLVHHLAFPAVVVAAELIRPRLHLLRVGFEAILVDRNRGLEHDALAICGGLYLIARLGRDSSQSFKIATIEEEQRMARGLPVVTAIGQRRTDLFIVNAHAEGPVWNATIGTKKGRAFARPPGFAPWAAPGARALFRPFQPGREGELWVGASVKSG